MSNIFAIVDNGKVVNVVVSEIPLADNWVQSDVAGIGWSYDGITFTAPLDPTPTEEEIRDKRNRLLAASDWTQVADAPVNQVTWVTYRQALRDVPNQIGFPETVIWPIRPE